MRWSHARPCLFRLTLFCYIGTEQTPKFPVKRVINSEQSSNNYAQSSLNCFPRTSQKFPGRTLYGKNEIATTKRVQNIPSDNAKFSLKAIYWKKSSSGEVWWFVVKIGFSGDSACLFRRLFWVWNMFCWKLRPCRLTVDHLVPDGTDTADSLQQQAVQHRGCDVWRTTGQRTRAVALCALHCRVVSYCRSPQTAATQCTPTTAKSTSARRPRTR